jgi:flagellar hook-associated protein 2
MSIASLGVGSGLDLGALVQQLVSAERAPMQTRLDRAQTQTQAQLSAVGGLFAAASGLQSAVDGLEGFEAPLTVRTTGSDAVSAVRSQAGGGEPAVYRVTVEALASAHSLASAAFGSDADVLGSGTMTLRVGELETEIEIGSSVQTLGDLRDAINDAASGVQAVLVRDGEGQRLLLTSRTSGAAGSVDVVIAGAVDGRLAGAAMSVTSVGTDARFSVNGLSLTSPSNEIGDVVPGVTMTLRNVTEGTAAATVAVERDNAAVRSRLTALVTAYNGVQERLKASAGYNAETREGGPLLGDSGVRSLQTRLAGVFAERLPGLDGANLLDLGLSVGVDGRASLDAAKLDEALRSDPAGVEARLSAFADMFGARLGSFSGPDGMLQTRVDGLTGRLREIADQRETLDLRMARVEERLRAQFSALDTMLAQFQNTSAYLASQLASLGNIKL